MDTLKILNDNILVAPLEADEITKSGLILSTVSQTGFKMGKVVGISNGWESFGHLVDAETVAFIVEGDIVFYKASQEFTYKGNSYDMVKYRDIVAVEPVDDSPPVD